MSLFQGGREVRVSAAPSEGSHPAKSVHEQPCLSPTPQNLPERLP